MFVLVFSQRKEHKRDETLIFFRLFLFWPLFLYVFCITIKVCIVHAVVATAATVAADDSSRPRAVFQRRR